ncbi:MAG: LPS assembly protein LptD [Desulfarculus sp.]|nr:LPS assembly protein LptD [Pseudomonadota bacterium]MBU4575501.1 LPS assembly protein LptD [Pseudomonadota bacterium]MBV1715437.1 LPS assembly protein LptD [Desulfarculus sp.]MBV1737632.1 LPS assembly protein LptD [Desulfarculus sp.]MBV1753372.1 LPS assembly protein LptD [Desulfarculus sp.]
MLLLAGVAGFFCLPQAASALTAPSSGTLMRVDAQGPVDVRADKVFYNEKTATYSAEGEVEIARGETRLMADRVSLNANTLVAEAQGRVRLSSPTQVVTGKSMVVDLNNNTGKIYDGRIFIKTTNYYITGGEIAKTGKDTYHIQKGSFTTCDGADPAWKVTGEDMKVTVEGYGTVTNGAFRVKDFPILWTPYLMFPAKTKRQSGMLSPAFAQTQRDGFSFSLPYYQTLGEDQDMTLVLNYYSKRGLDIGLEYRYALDDQSKGMFMIDYMPDDSNGEALFSEGENAQVYHSRYWFRGKADQKLFNGTMDLKADIDIVSDQDYLREFTFGYSGYNASDRRLAEWFGRNLDPNTSLVRTNTINLSRSWSSATFNAGMLYYDDTSGNNKSTLQSLPTISFDATTQQLGNSSFYFGMGSAFTYYYREEGSTGAISDVNPYISLPLNFNDYIEFEPTFTWYQRFYAVDTDDTAGDPQSSGTNQVYNFSATASTYLYRVFDFGTAENPYKIKHAYRPFVTYDYRPSLDEDDIPDLAQFGNERTNLVSYGLKNTLTSKTMAPNAETGEMEGVYREFLRLNLYHSFDVVTYRDDANDDHYWGEVSATVEYLPTDKLYFQNTTSWDLYDNSFTRIDFLARASDDRGDSITLDYRYDEDGVKQLNTWIKVALTQEWYAGFINRHDFDGGSDFQTQYELGYQSQCWGFKAFYVDDITTRGFFLVFSLGGFGEILSLGQ